MTSSLQLLRVAQMQNLIIRNLNYIKQEFKNQIFQHTKLKNVGKGKKVMLLGRQLKDQKKISNYLHY